MPPMTSRASAAKTPELHGAPRKPRAGQAPCWGGRSGTLAAGAPSSSFLLLPPHGLGAMEPGSRWRRSVRDSSDTAVGRWLAWPFTLSSLQSGSRTASPHVPSSIFYQQSSPCGGQKQASQPASSHVQHLNSRPNLNSSPWASPRDAAPSQHSSHREGSFLSSFLKTFF